MQVTLVAPWIPTSSRAPGFGGWLSLLGSWTPVPLLHIAVGFSNSRIAQQVRGVWLCDGLVVQHFEGVCVASCHGRQFCFLRHALLKCVPANSHSDKQVTALTGSGTNWRQGSGKILAA